MNRILMTASLLALVATPAFAARDQIRIVGSSTVYPFTTAVAEAFGKATKMKTPVVEGNGTGGGMKLFCAGVGEDTPDFTDASRRIKKSEFDDCQKNGVKDIVEIKVGFDGVAFAHAKEAKEFALTKLQLFLALAKMVPDMDGKMVANPNKMWSDIDASLPKTKIEVLGPAPVSGTRDSLYELVMNPGAKAFPALNDLATKDAKAFEGVYKALREDGAYVEVGDNYNLIVQKLQSNVDAIGLFGYSYLASNAKTINSIPVDGVKISYDGIANGTYKVSRPLFIYVKKAHIGQIPGMTEFIAEYATPKALGPDGYLAEKGLVTLPDAEAMKSIEGAKALAVLTGEGLK